MKKTLIMLSIIGALTACSSTKRLQETKDLDKGVVAVDIKETVVETPTVEVEEVEAYNSDGLLITDEEKAETLYDKDGLLITDEEEIETLYGRGGLFVTNGEEEISLIMPEDIEFGFNEYNVKGEYKPALNSLAEALTVNEDLNVTIDGYTDNIGSEDYNDKLSLKRANSAKDYLVEMNIEGSRIETVGHGMDNPIASNETEEGRAENRRVEVTATR